jgi:fused signal recognition particle receptor
MLRSRGMVPFLRKGTNTKYGLTKTRETWFMKLMGLFQGSRIDDSLWDRLEDFLISADVGVDTTFYLIGRIKAIARDENMDRGDEVIEAMKREVLALLASEERDRIMDLMTSFDCPRPLVILTVGVNGSGKTTSIAKLAKHFQECGCSVMLAAADTFRAAAIEQLQVWGHELGVDVIAHRAAGDPAAVAYDALQASRARGIDVLIIDTAGRLHTKSNLMEELRKIHRVVARLDPTAPHVTLLVLDATIGQNGLAQAVSFIETVQSNGVFLAKLDGTAKGGIILSIGRTLGLPVLFIGTGESVNDISPFEPEGFVQALFAPVAVEE